MRFKLLLLFGMLGVSVFGQNIQKLALPDRVEDDKISKSLAIVPVFKFVSDTIEAYTMFGVDDKSKDKKKDLIIRNMPDMNGCVDTGYTYIFFSGSNSTYNQGYILTLIGNYTRSLRPIYFFVDRNNNLDLTDDGPPDTLLYKHADLVLRFNNSNNTEAFHQVKLSRVEYGQNIAYKNMLTDHFKKHSGKKIFTNVNYCYREQRFNTIAGNYVNGNDSFIIALKDMNNNGLFNESCIDRFYVGSPDEQIQTDVMVDILPDIELTYFEWNKKRYKLISIEPSGSFIQFQEELDMELVKELKVGKKIQNFSFVNLENQKEEIKNYKKKAIYLFFWNEEKLTEEDTIYLNKIHFELADRVHLLALNHGDVPRDVRKFRYYEEVSWPMAFSSTQLGRMFYLEAIPKGVYLNKKRKLVDENLSPKEFYLKIKGS